MISSRGKQSPPQQSRENSITFGNNEQLFLNLQGKGAYGLMN